VGQGVWKGTRAEVWSLILAQAGERTPPPTGTVIIIIIYFSTNPVDT